jgi:hypothetical protein
MLANYHLHTNEAIKWCHDFKTEIIRYNHIFEKRIFYTCVLWFYVIETFFA